jgi:hypothetical protein
VHHVISRFVDRSWQLSGDDERDAYLFRLGRALARSDWTLVGFVLMSSHVHLVLESGEGSLEAWTKSVHSAMARWLNHRHGRLGPVFADRPYAEALCPSRVPYVLAYVHNNPVRARLVGWAGDISWSSHRAYLGLEAPPPALAVRRGLELCGYPDDAAGRVAFDEWVRGCVREQHGRAEALARRARSTARERTGGPVELTTPTRTEMGLRFPVVAPAGAMMTPERFETSSAAVIAAVSELLGIDPRGRSARDHRPAIAQARRLALLTWQRAGGRRVEMARALGIGASAASELVHQSLERAPHHLVEQVCHRIGHSGAHTPNAEQPGAPASSAHEGIRRSTMQGLRRG